VVVAWDAVLANVHDFQRGHNVTLHEFAHQLDTEDGVADGVPLLETRSAYASWARALRPEFERLQAGTHEGALDRYGAEHPAEFFAVATEAYFEKPLELRRLHPELYAELARFYRIDPTSGSQTRARDGS